MSFLSPSYLLDGRFLSLEVSAAMFLIYPCKVFYEYLCFGNDKDAGTQHVSHVQLLEVN